MKHVILFSCRSCSRRLASIGLPVLFLLLLSLCSSLALPLAAQTRDFRAQRFVLDDDNSDGDGFHQLILEATALSANRTLHLPDADGTLLFSTTPLLNSQILFGNGAGGLMQSPLLTFDQGSGLLSASQFSAGSTVLSSGEISGLSVITGESGGSIDLTSYGSVVVNIDEDNNGIGSSFVVEANGSSADLFAVTETGLTTINSTSSSGALRVVNTNGVGTAEILRLSDGSSDRLVVRRNGNVGIGATPPAARLDVAANSSSTPALHLLNAASNSTALHIESGNLLLAYGRGSATTIPGDVSVWVVEDNGTTSGLTVALPSSATDGQLIYVFYDDAESGTVGGVGMNQGEGRTFVHAAGSWRAL